MAACSSRTFSNVLPQGLQNAALSGDATTPVTVKITVATKDAALTPDGRSPRYFSPSSKGLLVQAYPHGKTKELAQVAVDISAGSVACGKKKTIPRTCSVRLKLPPSKGDDFVITDYNLKPQSGKIPKSGKLLGYGKLTNEPISASPKKNVFGVYLGGVIARLSGNKGFVSFPGDGSAHSLAILVHPSDFGNKPISAGTNDPFANPITVMVEETGGSGHTHLSLNGGVQAASVTVKYSTDAVQVHYDGGGSIGYGATVTLRARRVRGKGGAAETIAIGPLLLGSTSADFSAGALALKGNGDYAKIAVSDLNAPASTAFTAVTRNCSAIESTMPVIQSSASSGSFAVIARGVAATPNPANCAIDVSDGTSTLTLVVSNTYVGSLGSPTIETMPIPHPSASPVELIVGPDGALWFTECAPGNIARIASGSSTISEFSVNTGASPQPAGLTAGPDGNLWFTDANNAAKPIGKMTTAGSIATLTVPNPTPGAGYVVTGADGNLWFTSWDGGVISRVTTRGSVSTYASGDDYLGQIALGPDGNLWFTEHDANKIGKITTDGTITSFDIPHANSYPWGITAGPDGAMWFTECNGGTQGEAGIGRIPTTATSGADITEYDVATGWQPLDITVGPDGALWFSYWNYENEIGRITTAGAFTHYTIPGANATAPHTWGITSAPDGAIWFVEEADNLVGRIKIASTPALPYRSPAKIRLHGS